MYFIIEIKRGQEGNDASSKACERFRKCGRQQTAKSGLSIAQFQPNPGRILRGFEPIE
jgi:hypothetical protein